MWYLYLDESGDLGFDFSKHGTSKYFVIGIIAIYNKRHGEKIIKKIFTGFTKTEIKRHAGMLHCYKETPQTRIKLFNKLKENKIPVLVIYLKKSKVYTKLQDEKQVLYNYVTNIILDRIFTKRLVPSFQDVCLIASRRETNKFLNLNFKDYLSRQVKNNHGIHISIEIKPPQEEKNLQIADFVSWAVFRKYEFEDDFYYNIIRDSIIEENPVYK